MSAENALVLLSEVRGHFAARSVEGVPGTMSASIGIAANPPHGSSAEDLWRAAGEALMRAKRDGRDRIALYVEQKMVLKSNYYSKAWSAWPSCLPRPIAPKSACCGRLSTIWSTSTETHSDSRSNSAGWLSFVRRPALRP
jgi:hypothetical protein